ncbi:MAG TPA: zinc-dependent alcohol dehydrogenase [Bryobacteraceae bacterium]|jgi:alcohol dehydrogenase, propanol-preferring|nr:zinc-dependent alcohol dehydrogenase [Bryobacteraceae bacterium]
MKAAVLREIGKPLTIEDVPTPSPGAGQVLIRVEACGVCHSDVHLADGDWDLLRPITKTPLILGHEVAGTVAQLGPGVTEHQVGDRVGVPWIHWTCGECEFCREGRETLCLKQKVTGCMVDGGFAEYLLAPATHATPLPASLSSAEAAPLLCAGVTVYKALKASAIQPGERLVVFGAGGLGHLAIQIARAMGAQVGAVDVSDEKLEFAKSQGAEWTVNSTAEPVHKRCRQMGGMHVAMVTAAHASAYETALRCLRRGGTLAVVGMANEPFKISAVSMVSGETRIVASAVGTRRDLRELFDLVEKNAIRCTIELRPLDQVTHVFDELKRGEVRGRVVLTM